jgi:hypothetical protein
MVNIINNPITLKSQMLLLTIIIKNMGVNNQDLFVHILIIIKKVSEIKY